MCLNIRTIIINMIVGLSLGRKRLFQATALMIICLHCTVQLEDTILHLLEVHVPSEDPIQTLLQILECKVSLRSSKPMMSRVITFESCK